MLSRAMLSRSTCVGRASTRRIKTTPFTQNFHSYSFQKAPENMFDPSGLSVRGMEEEHVTDIGLGVTLGNGNEADSAVEQGIVKYVDLSSTDVEALLKRVETKDEDKKKAPLVEEFRPVKKTKIEVPGDVPVGGDLITPLSNSDGPLAVLRTTPANETKDFTLPLLTVSFSHPIVDITSLNTVFTSENIALEPACEGEFRFLGTQVLQFKPSYRFKYSTEYRLTVRKGFSSVTGCTLPESVSVTFTTPTLKCVDFRCVKRKGKPLVRVAFDQEVKPDIVKHMDAMTYVDNEQLRGIVATDAQFTRLPDWHRDSVLENLNDATTVWVTPVALEDKHREIVLKQGALSTEGALPTPEPLNLGVMSTVPPLEISNHHDGENNIGRPITISFTNTLHVPVLDAAKIIVEPAIPNMEVTAEGNTVTLIGKKKGGTTYKVKILAGGLEDVYCQQNKNLEHTVKIEKPQPLMQCLVGHHDAVVVPFSDEHVNHVSTVPFVGYNVGRYALSYAAVNCEKISYTAWVVDPSQYPSFSKRHATSRSGGRQEEEAYLKAWAESCGLSPAHNGELDLSGQEEDTPYQININFAQFLKEGQGHVVILMKEEGKRENKLQIATWVQATSLGCTTFSANGDCFASVTDLTTGASVQGATIEEVKGTTDANGIVMLPENMNFNPLIVRHGEHSSFISRVHTNSRNHFSNNPSYVFTDRGLYKPGEVVHIKGVQRTRVIKDNFWVINTPEESTCTWKCFVGGKEIKGSVVSGKHGSFDFSIPLAEDITLGRAMVQIFSADSKRLCNVSFEVQEFRTPEYEVSCNVLSGENGEVVGGSSVAEVTAKYLSGGAISATNVDWEVQRASTTFTPPRHHDYVFQSRPDFFGRDAFNGTTGAKNFQTSTNANGSSRLLIEHKTTSKHDGMPYIVSVNASVQDVNRQHMEASTSFVLHPASTYVGLKLSQTAKTDKDVKIDFCTCTIAGKPIEGNVVVFKVTREDTVVKDFKEVKVNQDVSSHEHSADGTGKASFVVRFEKAGRHTITATVTDETGRTSVSRATIWVNGVVKGVPDSKAKGRNRHMNIDLIADKTSYGPSDVAKVSIVSPYDVPLTGWVMWLAQGIVKKEQIAIEANGSQEVTYQLSKACMPGIRCDVKLCKGGSSPSSIHGSTQITVDTNEAKLDVQLDAPETAQPGDDISVNVKTGVKDSEVTLYIVDEAILSLAGYSQQDPVSAFYPMYYGNLSTTDTRDQIMDVNWDRVHFLNMIEHAECMRMMPMACGFGGYAAQESCRMMKNAAFEGAGAAEEAAPSVALRTNFSPLAAFEATLLTDANGEVTCKAKLPDNLTRYRVMCFAQNSTTQQFGTSDASLQVSLPLMVRPSFPRFLMTGDKCAFTVVLQSNIQQDEEVQVACRSLNLKHEGPKGFKVFLAAGKRTEVRFDVSTDMPGKAVFEVVAAGKKGADAAQKELPVYTSGVRTFATHGSVLKQKEIVVQKVTTPSDALLSYGGLRFTMSATVAGQLQDAVDYLVTCRYSYVESLASKLIALCCLKQVLPPVDLTLDVDKLAVEVLKHLEKAQMAQGSFGHFEGAWEPHAWVTIHTAHALVLARDCFPVKATMVENALSSITAESLYVNEARFNDDKSYYRELKARACYVLAKGGDARGSEEALKHAMEGFDKLSITAVAKLATANAGVRGKCLPIITKNIEEGSDKAHVMERVTDNREEKKVLMNTSATTNAAVLEALIASKGNETAIVKLCKGLMANRVEGKWCSSHQTAEALVAVCSYCKTFEGTTPNYTSAAWVGSVCVADTAFENKTTPFSTLVPMKTVAENKEGTVTIQKEGEGAMYYSMRLDYGSLTPMDSLERGITVVTEMKGKNVEPTANGYKIALGSAVTVRHIISVEQARDNVVIYGALPAGLENAALVKRDMVSLFGAAKRRCLPSPVSHWDHVNLRDASVEAFVGRLPPGTSVLAYTVTATSPGTFKLPPTIAEELYTPDVRGSTSEMIVVVA